MEPIRHAIIGCGVVASYGHLPGIATTPGLRLVAAADLNPEAAARAVSGTGGRSYSDGFAMLERERPESLTITTIDDSHFAYWQAATRLGIHVFCEKPLGADVAQARAMVAGSAAAGTHLATCFPLRTHLGSLCLREIRDSGRIGRIESVRIVWNWDVHGVLDPANRARRSRLSQSLGALGCGVHDVDLAAFFGGSPIAAMTAQGINPEPDQYGPPGHIVIAGTLADGTLFQIDSSSTLGRSCRTRCRINRYDLGGDRGFASFISEAGEEPYLRVVDDAGVHIDRLPGWQEKDWAMLYRLWAERLRDPAQGGILATGADGLRAQEVCEAAIALSRTPAPWRAAP